MILMLSPSPVHTYCAAKFGIFTDLVLIVLQMDFVTVAHSLNQF